MKLSVQLTVLHQINNIYDDFIGGYDLACDRLCASCCTRNVTMTTLEGRKIMQHLESNKLMDLMNEVKKNERLFRYTPVITTNQMAQMGYEGKDLPEEDMGNDVETCPVLESDQCLIYEARPFGCRCMVSAHPCRDKGYAETDPFIVTVNNVFFQFIEHIDSNGYFGNFTDILLFLESAADGVNNEPDSGGQTESPLLKNLPLSVLLIPPEYREKITPILEALQNIKVPAGI